MSQKKSSGKQLPLNLQPKTEDSKVVKETSDQRADQRR